MSYMTRRGAFGTFISYFLIILIGLLNITCDIQLSDPWTWIKNFNLSISDIDARDKSEYIRNQLRRNHIDTMYKDENGTTFLQVAAANGKYDLVEFFISEISPNDSVADYINFQDKYLDSAFHKACFNGHLNIVKLLIIHGANIYSTTQGGALCLHITAYNGHNSIIQLLVNDYKVPINSQTTSTLGTALHYATGRGQVETVKLLIDLGAKVDINTKTGTTSLHVAALKTNVEMMKVLISYGKADINIRTSSSGSTSGKTALDIYELSVLKAFTSSSSSSSSSLDSSNIKRVISSMRAELMKLYHDVNYNEEDDNESWGSDDSDAEDL